jgi:hypothetical protein
MCYSEKASIDSLIIGLLGSILLVILNTPQDLIFGFTFGFIALMQGIDYLLWRHPICDEYNKRISTLGMILNHLQPIVFGLLILVFNNKLKNKLYIVIPLILYISIAIPYSYQFLRDEDEQCTLQDKETKHLLWKWNKKNYSALIYILFIVLLLIFSYFGLPNRTEGVLLTLIGIIKYVVLYMFEPGKVVGTLWCYYTAFFPLCYYLYRII